MRLGENRAQPSDRGLWRGIGDEMARKLCGDMDGCCGSRSQIAQNGRGLRFAALCIDLFNDGSRTGLMKTWTKDKTTSLQVVRLRIFRPHRPSRQRESKLGHVFLV